MPTPPEPKPAAPHAAIGRVYDRQSALARRFPAWQARTLDQMLDAAAAEFPTRPYLITDTQTWTYSDIQAWSERLAAGLLAAGVQPGDHVAMLMANHPEFVAVKFAISRVGAVAVPINFLNRRDELGYVLRQSDAVLLVTMDSFRGLDYLGFLDELAPGWATHGGGAAFPRLKQVVVFPASGQPLRAGAKALSSLGDGAAPWQPVAHPGPASNSDIIYTSGTTGSPKGVMLSHDMMLRAAFGSAWGRAFEDGRR
ncbi:MAG: acyl--CoA ligase, partial [Betaproteobacteria bacterium]|nr:acyl--CoA ligase [Betaproteobacteria bacterium]